MLSIFALGLLAVSLGAEATSNSAKIKLTSRKITSARSSSASQKRGFSPANVPLADFFLGTDLQCVVRMDGRGMSHRLTSFQMVW
jgi:hypothetical protein